MEKVLILIDAGFLSKLGKYFGNGKYLKYDIIKFAEKLSKKQNLLCEHIFYYTAPPFQPSNPTKAENKRKENYDKFIKKLNKNNCITIREGRCQRITDKKNNFTYSQKGVDTLIVMDLMSFKKKYLETNKIILIASDSDFVPMVKQLKQENIEIILYTFFERKRTSNFSTSNHLLNAVTKYVKLTKQDFDNAPIKK